MTRANDVAKDVKRVKDVKVEHMTKRNPED